MENARDRSERLRVYRILLVVGALVAVLWLFWAARGALFPFILGLVLAYLLAPLVNRIQRVLPREGLIGRARRTLAVVIVYVIAAALMVAMIMTVGQRLLTELLEFIDSLPDNVTRAKQQSDSWNEQYERTVPADIRRQVEASLSDAQGNIGSVAKATLGAAFGTVSRVAGFVTGLALLPLWLFYVLKDQRKAMTFFYDLWPANIRDDVREIVGIADRVLGAYVRGQLFLGFVIGIVTFAGLWILDIQYAGALGVVAGFFEMVPIIGPWLSFIAAAIVVLATDPGKIWVVAIFFLVVQQIENVFLVPTVQGDAVDMNPAVIIVLLVVGGAVFGLIGVIVIVPLAAIARDVFKYVYARLSEEANLPETPL